MASIPDEIDMDWGVFLRKIGKQRARKLRRRGESVWWSAPLNSRVWVSHVWKETP